MKQQVILIPSTTDDHLPSVMYVTEVIGQTEGKTRAGIEGTTAKVIEAYHCGSRGEVLRDNTIYLHPEPRITLAAIRDTFPRLHDHIMKELEQLPIHDEWTSIDDHKAGRCKIATSGEVKCLYCHSFGRYRVSL